MLRPDREKKMMTRVDRAVTCNGYWDIRSAYGVALPSSSRPSSWTLHNAIRDEDDGNADAQEWDPHDDGYNTHNIEDTRIQERLVRFTIFGFHTYRLSSRGVAYHLKSYKLQDLGNMYPKVDILIPGGVTWMKNAFMYTPCGWERRMKFQRNFPDADVSYLWGKEKRKETMRTCVAVLKKTQWGLYPYGDTCSCMHTHPIHEQAVNFS